MNLHRVGLGAFVVLVSVLVTVTGVVARPVVAAPSEQTGGFWEYVETINNADAPIPEGHGGTWSPTYGESSMSGAFTRTPIDGNTYTLSGSCTWSWQSDGSLDRLLPGEVVSANLNCTYSGIELSRLTNSLNAYAAFDAADTLGSAMYSGSIGTPLLQIFGPSSSASDPAAITVPAGQVFPEGRAALEVNMSCGGPVTQTVQRVYRWVEGQAAGAAGTVQDCQNAVSLYYSPPAPADGDVVRLTASLDPVLASSVDLNGQWVIDSRSSAEGVIDDFDGCITPVEYMYTCNGQSFSQDLVIPGAVCEPASGWTGVVTAGGALALAAASAAAALRWRKKRNSQAEHHILEVSTAKVTLTPGQTVRVDARVWKVTPQGGYTPAPSATLSVVPPGTPAGLVLAPTSGKGTLSFGVTAPAACSSGDGEIVVRARAAGTSFRQTVAVQVKPAYRLEMTSQDQGRNRVPRPPDSLWAYARVVSDQPVPQAELDRMTAALRLDVKGDNAAAVQSVENRPHAGWQAVRLAQTEAGAQGAGNPSLVAVLPGDDAPPPESMPLVLVRPVVLRALVLGSRQASARYDAKTRQWTLPDIQVYFTEDDGEDRPVQPPFAYGFPTPPFVSDSPALSVEEWYRIVGTSPEQYTLRLQAAPGVDLARAVVAGSESGRREIRVTVVALDDRQQRYEASVTFSLLNVMELCLSPERLALRADHEEQLRIELIEDRQGTRSPVTDGGVAIRALQTVSGLTMNPIEARAPLRVQLSLDDLPDVEQFELECRGEAQGYEPVTVTYLVALPFDYGLRFLQRAQPAASGSGDGPAGGDGSGAGEGIMLPPDGSSISASAEALNSAVSPVEVSATATKGIAFNLENVNMARVLVGVPDVRDGARCVTLTYDQPLQDYTFEDEDPWLVARLEVGEREVQPVAIRINLDECRLAGLKKDLQAIANQLVQDGYYIRNAYLGTPVVDHVNRVYGMAWDRTAGWVFTANKGLLCEDVCELTQAGVLAAVKRVYGIRATLETMEIEELSYSGTGIVNFADRRYHINHMLFKLTAANGKEYSIDFWDYFRKGAGNAPILQAWSTTQAAWVAEFGDDVDKTTPFKPRLNIQQGLDRPRPPYRPRPRRG